MEVCLIDNCSRVSRPNMSLEVSARQRASQLSFYLQLGC
jgi:hypothetical protein